MISLGIKADPELAAKARSLSGMKVREAAFDAALRSTAPMVETAKSLVPVETGLLRDSLGLVGRKYRRGLIAFACVGPRKGFGKTVMRDGGDVYSDPTKYSHLVERGTSKMAAHPFLLPAFLRHEENAKQTVGRIVGAAIEAVINKASSRRKIKA